MLKFRDRAAFAALVCVCVLAACGDPPPEPQASGPATTKNEPPPKVANLAKDMVAAVSAGKASNVISLHFALRATPTVNTALPVDVAIVPHRDFTSLRVHFDSQDGLAATAGDTFGPKADVNGETPITHQLVLLPTKEGMFMVTSSVETEGAEGNITRIFSIPIIVSAAAGSTPAPAPESAPAPAAEPAKN
jgi:hypothetical protein